MATQPTPPTTTRLPTTTTTRPQVILDCVRNGAVDRFLVSHATLTGQGAKTQVHFTCEPGLYTQAQIDRWRGQVAHMQDNGARSETGERLFMTFWRTECMARVEFERRQSKEVLQQVYGWRTLKRPKRKRCGDYALGPSRRAKDTNKNKKRQRIRQRAPPPLTVVEPGSSSSLCCDDLSALAAASQRPLETSCAEEKNAPKPAHEPSLDDDDDDHKVEAPNPHDAPLSPAQGPPAMPMMVAQDSVEPLPQQLAAFEEPEHTPAPPQPPPLTRAGFTPPVRLPAQNKHVVPSHSLEQTLELASPDLEGTELCAQGRKIRIIDPNDVARKRYAAFRVTMWKRAAELHAEAQKHATAVRAAALRIEAMQRAAAFRDQARRRAEATADQERKRAEAARAAQLAALQTRFAAGLHAQQQQQQRSIPGNNEGGLHSVPPMHQSVGDPALAPLIDLSTQYPLVLQPRHGFLPAFDPIVPVPFAPNPQGWFAALHNLPAANNLTELPAQIIGSSGNLDAALPSPRHAVTIDFLCPIQTEPSPPNSKPQQASQQVPTTADVTESGVVTTKVEEGAEVSHAAQLLLALLGC